MHEQQTQRQPRVCHCDGKTGIKIQVLSVHFSFELLPTSLVLSQNQHRNKTMKGAAAAQPDDVNFGQKLQEVQ